MKKVLVLVQGYPDNEGNIELMYVHVRNKYYIEKGIDVTVLNFKSKKNYLIDGVRVINEVTYKEQDNNYDTIITHAPNIRNHYRFLKRYGYKFNHIIFFFHGHEILMINKVYPEPFKFINDEGWIKKNLQNLYDMIKIKLRKKYFDQIMVKSDFIFVSNSLYKEFNAFFKYDNKYHLKNVHIINNSVGEIFEKNEYDSKSTKRYDFITIRNDLDSSTYCIDLVCKLALKNPEFRFLIIGRGTIFNYIKKPENVVWVNKFLPHNRLLSFIDVSSCALMLTRRDTQGVMSCELVTYGIPLITSDIPVCHEIFDNIKNVSFISNDVDTVRLKDAYNSSLLETNNHKVEKYNYINTVKKEVEIICDKSFCK